MPPRGSKTVSKRCPRCRKPLPVATKNCQCGHHFFEERRKSTASTTSEQTEENLDENQTLDMKSTEGNDANSVLGTPEGKRRSERVKREKPNFYDASQYENQMKKERKKKLKEVPERTHITSGRIKRERKIKNRHSDGDDEDDYHEPVVKERRKKKKKKKKKVKEEECKEEEDDSEEIMAGISLEKEWQYSIVLSDINLKLGLNNPKFIKI